MISRQRLFFRMVFGVLAIVLTTTIIVGWNIIFPLYYVIATDTRFSDLGVGYWLILSIGDVFLVTVVVVLVLLLVNQVKTMKYVWRQTTFLDSVTHELKSPLASLRLCVDTIDLRSLDAERKREFVDMMRADIDRLQDFIEHLLEAGRLEHKERSLEREVVSISEVVSRCVEQMRRRYELKPESIETVTQLEQGHDTINTDRVALEAIILNLLDNAVKYSGEHVSVVLTTAADKDALAIEVSDRGMGIAKRDQKEIFRRFHRLAQPPGRYGRGTGLGLYVVRGLTEQLGGRITVKSEGEGRGTIFRVVLPHESGSCA